MTTTLFISPHLDDVVLSCAGALQRVVAGGNKPMIVTVFSEGNGHALRRNEDARAAAHLGAQVAWLEFLDAPDRSSSYRDFESLIFGRDPVDETLPREIAEKVRELMAARQVDTIYAPLGVGTHIDHRLCFEAVRRLESGPRVCYYEERPYCYAAGSVELRLHELGCVVDPPGEGMLLQAFRRLPHVRAYLPPGAARRRCETHLLQPLQREPAKAGLKPRPHVLLCNGEETMRAHAAAAMHTSQFEAFCGSTLSLKRRDARHARSLGTLAPRAERCWELPPLLPS